MIRNVLKRLNFKRRPSGTELKQLEEQLRANLDALERRELTLKKMQEIAQIGSWEYHIDDAKLFCSDEIYDIAGIDREVDLLNFQVLDSILGSGLFLVQEMYEKMIHHQQDLDLTVPAKTPLGYSKWVRIYAFPVVEHGRISRVTGMVQDVTRFKEAEELIRTNEKKYRSLFEQASDAIMVVDFKGNFLNVNESMCKMVGYSREEILQLNLHQVLEPTHLRENPIRFDVLAAGGQVFNERKMLHKNGSVVLLEANAKMFDENQIMAIARDIRERKQIEDEKEYARYLLKERIKELTTLYRAGQIMTQDDKSLNEILQETVSILPAGWQYPSVCEARITFGELQFTTPGFRESIYRQAAEFQVQEEAGVVEIVYLEPKQDEVEGPFLFEERTLLNAVTEMLEIYLSRKREADALNKSQANLGATINNTEILIWSVDRNFRLLSFNKPFANYIRDYYGVEAKEGQRVFAARKDFELEVKRVPWREIYMRALSGEAITLDDVQFGMEFKYSLSPIIEGDSIIGVSAFADNVTERNQRDRALVEANKKIGELKVMALRSVMNPHFIFNVLNSIQYFIVKNDRLNAVNFLSTFSKLIRNVLTYSLDDKIKLSDEIEMLKDYVELEMVRFENKFEFVLELEEGLDVDSIQIPSLLIQPYVENAILHGLYNKRENGRLRIYVRKAERHVIFEVEDDGVGRDAAEQLRRQNPTNHKSVGTKLTEARLKLMEEKPGVSVEFEDLETNGCPSGTKVKIKVKLL